MEETLTAAYLIACFEDAAATLAALPAGGYSTRMAVTFREIAADPDAPPSTDFRDRPARPSAAKIDAMDIIFRWLAIIPEKKKTLRRIVAMRSMLNRAGEPPSWRGIANRVRADHRAVARWHAQGIAIICNELNRRAGHATAETVFVRTA